MSKFFYSCISPLRSAISFATVSCDFFYAVAEFSAKRILAKAWNITHAQRGKLFWYGFWPSFVSITVGVAIVYFQTELFLNSQIFNAHHHKGFLELLAPIWIWMRSPQIPTGMVIASILLIFISSFLVPVFCQGAVIGMTQQYQKDGTMQRGIGRGFIHFLPLFQFSLLKSSLQPFSIGIEFLFFLRFLGIGALFLLEIIFGIWIVFGIFGLFFFTFTPQFIVTENSEPTSAMMQSLKKVFLFFPETFSLIMFFIFIELRVVFNVLVILLLPTVFVSMGGLIAHNYIGYFAEGGVAFIVLTISAILSGTLFVLGNVAWTLAYLELKQISAEEGTGG